MNYKPPMDNSLFSKHLLQIKKHETSKEEICLLIKEKTGIELDYEMFTVSKKQISFSISSVMKQKLHQKNIVKILEEKGYQTKF